MEDFTTTENSIRVTRKLVDHMVERDNIYSEMLKKKKQTDKYKKLLRNMVYV